MTESFAASVAAGVRALLGAHTQAQDAGRADDVAALYAPDGVLELPGAEPVQGHSALRETFKGWTPTQPQLHLLTNTVVTARTPEEARAVSDVVFLQRGESGWTVQVVGHYDDTFRRIDGSWRFQRRVTTFQA
ncbi:nuclear transport factor 2 family protein [Streptomyces sp. NPDC002577]